MTALYFGTKVERSNKKNFSNNSNTVFRKIDTKNCDSDIHSDYFSEYDIFELVQAEFDFPNQETNYWEQSKFLAIESLCYCSYKPFVVVFLTSLSCLTSS